MPAQLPPVNGVSWSVAAAEAMHYATMDRVLLDTITFEHASISTSIALVADYTPFSGQLENGGPTVEYLPAAVAVQELAQEADGRPVLVLRIAGVSGEAAELLRQAARTTSPLVVTHRVYASDDPSGPARLPVTRLEVVEVPRVDDTAVEIRAARGDPTGRGYPAKSYTRAEYPGLRP